MVIVMDDHPDCDVCVRQGIHNCDDHWPYDLLSEADRRDRQAAGDDPLYGSY